VRVLVIGATGFVGSHVTRALLAAGHEVTGFKRSTSSLELLRGIELPWFEGDLRDADSIRCAIPGHEAVVLCAGTLSIWPSQRDRLYGTNVLGALNVARACLEARVRLVVDGSAGIYAGSTRLEPADESGAAHAERYESFHVTSMALAEAEVLRAVADGLDAVILHPTLVVGAGDLHHHSSWLLVGAARARVELAPPGGVNLVSAGCVARAHVLALDRARRGARYLLGGENLANHALLALLLDVLGEERPVHRISRGPFRALGAVAHALAVASGRSKRDRFDLNADLARAATLYWFVDSSKASSELGWKAEPVRPALEEQVEWLRRRGAFG
jgi:dihydroflavonol-4-reductase